jgi:hypothetical protein
VARPSVGSSLTEMLRRACCPVVQKLFAAASLLDNSETRHALRWGVCTAARLSSQCASIASILDATAGCHSAKNRRESTFGCTQSPSQRGSIARPQSPRPRGHEALVSQPCQRQPPSTSVGRLSQSGSTLGPSEGPAPPCTSPAHAALPLFPSLPGRAHLFVFCFSPHRLLFQLSKSTVVARRLDLLSIKSHRLPVLRLSHRPGSLLHTPPPPVHFCHT